MHKDIPTAHADAVDNRDTSTGSVDSRMFYPANNGLEQKATIKSKHTRPASKITLLEATIGMACIGACYKPIAACYRDIVLPYQTSHHKKARSSWTQAPLSACTWMQTTSSQALQ